MVVVPFQVYEITRSTLAVGLVGLAELMPVFVFPIVGGGSPMPSSAAVSRSRRTRSSP